MLTLDQAQFNYDSEIPDERTFCFKCEDEIDGDYVFIDDNCHCEYCAEKAIED